MHDYWAHKELSPVLVQVLEDAQAAGEPVADIAAAVADGEAIKAEIITVEGEGRLVVITVEPEAMEAMPEPVEATTEAEVQPEDSEPAKKPARKDKGKRGAGTRASRPEHQKSGTVPDF